jgi:hypothetical protein
MELSSMSLPIYIVATWAHRMDNGGQIGKICPIREFEAESVSYLVCTRPGIDTASDEYLAAYVWKCPVTPAINLDRVMKSVWLLEQMGRAHLGLRGRQFPNPA